MPGSLPFNWIELYRVSLPSRAAATWSMEIELWKLWPAAPYGLAPVSQNVLPPCGLLANLCEQPCTIVKSFLWRASGARPSGSV